MAALARRAAFRLFTQTRNFILHLEIQSPWLTMGLASIGLGAFYVHQSDSDPQHATIIPDELNVVPAVKKGVEGNEGGQIDPEVMRIGPGSIVVKLVCHTEQSFLMFIEDFKEGKIKTRLETEFGNIGCKEPLTVTIPNWDDEVQKNLNAIRVEKIKDAVCLIECMDQEKKVKFTGTGFHYGSGWVMTAAHIFQDDENDDKTSHSYLSEGEFRVVFHVKGKEYKFPQRKRMAFVHHLNPGEATDFENKDIGMVKLGIQYEYGRNQDDYSDWEEEEKKMLDEMLPSNFGLVQVAPAEPKVEDSVHVVYYGVDNESKLVKEVKITDIAKGADEVPMLHLEKRAGVLPAGSSGCPVTLEKDGNYHLVGLHFSGGEDDQDGEAKALLWENGIASHVTEGISLIKNIGGHPVYKCRAENSPHHTSKFLMRKEVKEKKVLEWLAKKNRLTTYLTNGEIIKGLKCE